MFKISPEEGEEVFSDTAIS